MNKEKYLGFTPWIELFIRGIYYSDSAIFRKIVQKKKLNHKHSSIALSNEVQNNKWNAIKNHIDSLNIHDGDILIVHSSAEALYNIGINPKEALDYLLSLVGEHGTLVIPCFPLYDEKNFDIEKKKYICNPKGTICSTGLIPNLFLRMPGVIRSKFPWNTLAAKGPLAGQMMMANLETDLAHGKNSAWEFCMNHNAKILLLGVKSSHTTTMVHVAEDLLDEKWPIDNWYEFRTFIIKEGQLETEKSIRIRKQKWVKYNASWYRSNQLIKHGILLEESIEGFNVGYISDSKSLVDFIIQRTLEHRPFFVVPKRCYKS